MSSLGKDAFPSQNIFGTDNSLSIPEATVSSLSLSALPHILEFPRANSQHFNLD